MTGDAFRQVWKAEPFRPFRLHLASGRTVDVVHPELVALSPGGRTAAIFPPGSDGAMQVDLLLVETLEPLKHNGGKGRNGKG